MARPVLFLSLAVESPSAFAGRPRRGTAGSSMPEERQVDGPDSAHALQRARHQALTGASWPHRLKLPGACSGQLFSRLFCGLRGADASRARTALRL